MTRDELIARIAQGVQRSEYSDDSNAGYIQLVKDALKEIQNDRSWGFMLDRGDVIVLTGTSSIAMPANFKELSNSRTPIHLVGSDGLLSPVDIVNRAKRIRWAWMYPDGVTTTLRVYIDWTASPPLLNIHDTASENITFRVDYFGYLDDLASGSSTNVLTVDYPEMVIAKAKALALAGVNDEMAASFEGLYEAKKRSAALKDSFALVAGMQLRM
jgi:hypothetical protein